jgi:hypothetical protein
LTPLEYWALVYALVSAVELYLLCCPYVLSLISGELAIKSLEDPAVT